MGESSGFEHFRTEKGTLVLGDTRDMLGKVPSNSIDHVIANPPWGVGFDEYDDLNAFLGARDELYRVMKPDSCKKTVDMSELKAKIIGDAKTKSLIEWLR
jgi:predicted RNA methylase